MGGLLTNRGKRCLSRPGLAVGPVLIMILGPAHRALATDWPVNLAPVANRGFVDHGPGQGRRGWSGQGPSNSLRGMKPGLRNFAGMEFRIINEKANRGAAVLTFNGANSSGSLREATAKVPAVVRRSTGPVYLYLLHTACWAAGSVGRPVGTVDVHYANGRDAVIPVVDGRDVADWWNPADEPNAKVAYTRNNGQAEVGLYVSKFLLPQGRGRPRSITLRTAQGPVWIVVAMTLSDKSLPMSGGRQTIRADAQWRPVDLRDLLVKRHTALDLSFLLDAPAGKHGFIEVNRQGQLVFADEPGRPARFLCDAYNMAVITSTLMPFTQTRIREFARQEARMGINALRPHNLDAFLMFGSKQDGVLNPKQLKLWDYFSAALRSQGIYLFLDLTTYSLFNKNNIWTGGGAARHFDTRIYWDPYVRDVWRRGVTTLLDHVDPYTGLALKDNPQVIVMQTRNESTLFKFLTLGRPRPHPGLTKVFRRWLRGRYGTTAALRRAWTVRNGEASTCYLPLGQTLQTVSFPRDKYNGPAAMDFQRFCIDSDQQLFLWMQDVLKHVGAKVPATDFNYIPSYDLTFTRDVLPLVDMHCYHEHPSNYTAPGSRQMGRSALNRSDPLGYLCSLAGARQLGKPFTVSKTGEPFWNRWRFESGLCWPSLAALQGWSLVSQFGQAVILTTNNPRCSPLQPFLIGNDPPNRAGQYMAALLYLRGDVRSSPHVVEMRLNRRKTIATGQGMNGIPNSLSRLCLVAGFGCRVVGDPHAAPSAAIEPDLVISTGPDSRVRLTRRAANLRGDNGGTAELDGLVGKLMEKGVLGARNRTDVRKGQYESDTGQIFVDTRLRHIQVVTPESEGGTVLHGQSMHLPGLRVINRGAPAAVFLGALDDQHLARSAHLLLIVATDAVNSGISFRDHRQVLETLGHMPVLLRVARLQIRIRHVSPHRLRMWALGFDGARTSRIPLKASGNHVVAELNTGTLPNGPTPFFELELK